MSQPCPNCGATGTKYGVCSSCGGTGEIITHDEEGNEITETCPAYNCEGGKIPYTCPSCKGTGEVS